ncbi:uncharacterized protein K452DRAFT_332314 [Aplosporella prunicola CBS 121167]|uniref:N-acetyltransferase domain-containing protein n=1 Tax=Aplosporella prunicola CBS 121167 TaxID=1176127 RepID=A0A6A6BI97_9PEZI|nr:uncharacterized protein K452DRAFT_332314 [Aplosporella prunicola CBS 121167]KAF2142567.1 hypothetical protein K452DRAFT_332314 [Aplosporella prunicola CBS 121167]
MVALKSNPLQSGVIAIQITELTTLPAKAQQQVLSTVKRIEKKTFASGEVSDFAVELKKRNTHILVALVQTGQDVELMGYLLYVRQKRTTWLHKLCVLQDFRRKGIAKDMIQVLEARLRKEACDELLLWVDEENLGARALYASAGFDEVNRILDYYGPGRTGIKLVLRLD